MREELIMSKGEAPKSKPQPRSGKKPWTSPRIKTGKLYEMNSLACLKNTVPCGRTGLKTS